MLGDRQRQVEDRVQRVAQLAADLDQLTRLLAAAATTRDGAK